MKNLRKYIGLLLTILSVGMVGCQDEFDAPGIKVPEATMTPNATILEVKTKYWSDETNYIDTIGLNENGERIIVSGRVVSSDMTGNIYKNLVIQDETAALTLSINQSGLYNKYRVGQEIVLDVTGMYIGKYSGLQQLGFPEYAEGYGWQATFMPYEFFQMHSELNGLPEPSKVDTLTVTLSSLPTNPEGLRKYQSQLVRLNNVHFDGGGNLSYTDAHKENANRTLIDAEGNTITVRNSGYATFWSQKLPEGNGDVVGILSYFSSSGWQLLLRSTNDCMNFGNPTLSPGAESNPYSVDQVVELINDGQTASGWVTGYIVGAVAPEVENTITSNKDIEWGAPTTLNNTLVIAPTPEVRDIASCLVIALPQDSKLREYANLRDNEANLGRQIWLSGKFEQYMGVCGITGNKGTAGEFRIEGLDIPGETPSEGNGSDTAPYNVAQVKGGASGTGVWVQGYIVGWVDGADYENASKFSVPATVASNILISDNPNATSVDECIPVQLVSGSEPRSALNLVDNPGNLGKKVSLKGNIMTYFKVNGLKETSEYKLEGGSTPDVPSGPVTPVTSLNETFEGVTSISGLAGWTSKVVKGNKAWYFTSFDNNFYAACTAYKGTDDGNGYDSWLITPPLNVDGMSEKTFCFDSQAAYSGGAFEVYVMTTNDPATATLTKMDCALATPPASGYSGFVPSGTISLAQFSGTIYIGFRYTATTSASSMTYCIDNVKAPASATEEPSEPEKPSTPSEGEGSEATPFNVTAVQGGATGTGVWVEGYIVGWVNGADYEGASTFSVPASVASNILLSDNPNATSVAECIPVQLVSGSAVRSALNLVDNPGNLGKKVAIQGNIATYFKVNGLKETSAYKFTDGGNDTPAPEQPSEPDQPSTPVEGNAADFNTMNGGTPKSSYGEYTSTNGWKAINSALLSGTTGSDSNPRFAFLGDESVFAPCLNGKVGAAGVLTSPVIAGGIKKLSFNYGFPFSDTKCNITINIKQNGAVVKSDTLDITSITKFQVYNYSLDVNVDGNFEIEIVNNCASQSTSNKDRIAIWNLTWTN